VSSSRASACSDFGYGTVGHIRLLASLGCDAHGVDVEPVFGPLYSQPGDQGVFRAWTATRRRITLHCGGGRRALDRPRHRREYDIITSKNTLNAATSIFRPADSRTLVRLGWTMARISATSSTPSTRRPLPHLQPLPAQALGHKPYIPWADGSAPFRDRFWNSGFEVIEFDQRNRTSALDYCGSGITDGKSPRRPARIVRVYTLCRKP